MDLWSALFLAMVSGFIVYFGLGIVWVIRYFTEPFPTPVIIADQFPGLALAMVVTLLVPAILLVLHITNVITMWEVGRALTHL